jgi:20S proteasome alpha/beta subunit
MPFYSILLLLLLLLLPTWVSSAGTETLIGIVGRDFVMLGADRSVARSIVLTSTQVDKIRVVKPHVAMAATGELADVEDLLGILQKQVQEREGSLAAAGAVDYIVLEDSVTVPLPPSTLLNVSAMAKLARNVIAQRLRSRAPYQQLGLLMAGMQKEEEEGLPKSGVSFAEEVRKQLERISSSSTTTTTPGESTTTTDPVEPNSNNLRPCLFWLDEYGSLQKVDYGIVGLSSNFGLAVLDQGYRENLSRPEAAALIRNCFQQLQTRFLINYSPQPPLLKCVDENGCREYTE